MGFSILGLAVSVAVLAPNLLLLIWPPHPWLPRVFAPRPLAWTERAGQALCMVVPATTTAGPILLGWSAPLVVSVFGYWLLWGRYARLRTPAALFGPVRGIPVPMAILPVAAFLSCAMLLSNPWITVAAVVLASGHIPVSLLRARALHVD